MTTLNRNILRIGLATGCLLMIPLVAMQFSSEVNWSVTDFIFMGALLFGSGLTFLLIARVSENTAYRVAVGIAVVAGLILIWINLAVGIIGSEDNPANLMYFWVLSVGVIGAGVARFQPKGMARALFAMAIAQALVPVIALIVWKPSMEETPGVMGVFTLNWFFVMLFVLSALLFRHASATAQGSGDGSDSR